MSISKKSTMELHSIELHSKNDDANNEIEAPKKDTYHQKKRQQIIDELGLV